MIPPFNENGCLPQGVYDCTVEEAAERFGAFRGTSQRPKLWEKLVQFMHEAKSCELIKAMLLDGSFVTNKVDPNDIDLLLVVSANHDFSATFQPSDYNIISKRRISQRFGFDILVARADSEEYRRYLDFFQQVRLEPGRKKGILRLWLR